MHKARWCLTSTFVNFEITWLSVSPVDSDLLAEGSSTPAAAGVVLVVIEADESMNRVKKRRGKKETKKKGLFIYYCTCSFVTQPILILNQLISCDHAKTFHTSPVFPPKPDPLLARKWAQ